MTEWYQNPTYAGCAFGALNPPVSEAVIGRNVVTTHSQTYNFDPTDSTGQPSLPDPTVWRKSYDGTTYGHKVAMIVHTLGIRSTDPTTVPLSSTTATPTIQKIAQSWTPGDGSYEDKCITGWANMFKSLPFPVLARMWHEPRTSDWLNSQTYYIPAYRKVVNYFRSVTPNALFVWCPNGSLNAPDPETYFFPGSSYVDWIGVDAYSNVSRGMPSYSNLQAWYDKYNSVNGTLNPDHKPNMICEWGIEAATGRKAIFDEFKSLLAGQFSAFKVVTYWSMNANSRYGINDIDTGFLNDFLTWVKSPFMNPNLTSTGVTPLSVTITSPTAGATLNTQTVLIQARETTGATISNATVSVNGSTSLNMTFNSTTNRWEKTINAPLGSVTVAVNMVGTAGGTGSDTVNFTVSTVTAAPAPSISVISPSEGDVLPAQTVTVTADVESTVGINASSVQISVDNGATWQTMAAVPPGSGGQ